MKNDNDKVANEQFATMQTLQCNEKQSSFTSRDEAKAMETKKSTVCSSPFQQDAKLMSKTLNQCEDSHQMKIPKVSEVKTRND